jgi:hypothetical protein
MSQTLDSSEHSMMMSSFHVQPAILHLWLILLLRLPSIQACVDNDQLKSQIMRSRSTWLYCWFHVGPASVFLQQQQQQPRLLVPSKLG